ncbi:MAG: helix-turn-helix transcriptional regulator [Ruminococcaceae bacterium]|nr:helix-turn-helix transcriptional regulator [Oscillospiraceae bacterium]
MDFKTLNEIFSADFNIFNIVSMKYDWAPGAKAVYTHTPRKTNGLLMLTKHSATYRTLTGEEYPFKAGEIVLLPKGTYYTITFDTPDNQNIKPYMVNFDMCSSSGNDIDLGQTILKLTDADERHKSIFREIIQFYEENNIIKLKQKTYELLSVIFPLHEKDECMINYIKGHINTPLSIPELAKRSNMSESLYRKLFKEKTGVSPVHYITNLKIQKACQMLTYDDIKPDDISNFLGFSSSSYFYRVFKEKMKMTPKEFKNKL